MSPAIARRLLMCFFSSKLGESGTMLRTRFTIVLVFCTRNEDCHRRLYPISSGETSLIYGQTKTPARIDVQQRRLQRHVTEGAHERNGHLTFSDGDVRRLAPRVSQFEKILTTDICDQIAEWPIG